MSIKFVDLTADDPRWKVAYPVLQELRTHLTEELLRQVITEGEPQGLRFTAVFDANRCLAIAGWRILAGTSTLRKLYIDDLATTDTARSQGHGGLLLQELARRARNLGCKVLDLDSGVQRHKAHRFYFREGMHISSHHFTLPLGQQ